MPLSNPTLRAQQTWHELAARIRTVEPRLLDRLPLGAHDSALLAVENAIGTHLPPLVRELYRVHNGIGMPATEHHGDAEYVATSYFYSIEDALKTWTFLAQCFHDGLFADAIVTRADQGVRADWWNLRWLPISGDPAGNHYCVDLDPAPGGTLGQVIAFWHDDHDRGLYASDLSSFLLDYVDEGEWAAEFRESLKVN